MSGFDVTEHVPDRLAIQTDRWTWLAFAATGMALADADYDPSAHDPYATSVILGSGSGGNEFGQREIQALWSRGRKAVGAYQSIAWFYAASTGQLAIHHGAKGPCGVLVSDAASGIDSLSWADRAIRRGTGAVLAGGTEAPIAPYALTAQMAGGQPGPEFDDCCRAQPLLFAVGAALAFAVIARGLRPTVLAGHSVGELAAAAVAGVFSIADGSQVMAARTTAMAATEPGGMLAVAAGADRIREVLGGDLAEHGIAVAAINSPHQTVLSGATAALRAAEQTLGAAVIACRAVKARQAFHSPLCADAAIRFAELVRRIEFRPPAITVRSTCTARDVTAAESVTPEFWSAQLAKPVLFWPAMDDLLESGSRVFLEAGPKGSCAAVLHLHPTVRSRTNVVLPLLPAGSREDGCHVFDESVAAALAMAA